MRILYPHNAILINLFSANRHEGCIRMTNQQEDSVFKDLKRSLLKGVFFKILYITMIVLFLCMPGVSKPIGSYVSSRMLPGWDISSVSMLLVVSIAVNAALAIWIASLFRRTFKSIDDLSRKMDV